MKTRRKSWILLVVQVSDNDLYELSQVMLNFLQGLTSMQLCPYVKSVVGVDISQNAVSSCL